MLTIQNNVIAKRLSINSQLFLATFISMLHVAFFLIALACYLQAPICQAIMIPRAVSLALVRVLSLVGAGVIIVHCVLLVVVPAYQ